jgi:glucose-1-phosphate cytidylyltransferase
MRVAVLAGGLGSRLAEETALRPKPMVEVGGQPVLWHILRYYASFGFRDFTVALGYRGDDVRRWALEGGVEEPSDDPAAVVVRSPRDDWRVTLVETGLETQSGGRVKRLAGHLGQGTFLCTYGDGLATVDLDALLRFHRSHGRLATLTAVRPPARFGHLELDDDRVTLFDEKPQTGEGWINGGFFVFEPAVLDHVDGDLTSLEREPLQRLARDGELMAWRHEGFWQCMDTLRDKRLLEELWDGGRAPWRVWG